MSTNRMRDGDVMRALVMLLGALAIASCDARQEPAPASTTAAAEKTIAAPVPAPSISAPAKNAAFVLTAEGYGPLRVGMSLAEVTAALGPDADPQAVGGADPALCDQFRPARAPEGMLVMIESGRLTRISLIRENGTKTSLGVGLGSTADAVLAAYGNAARVSPHKYAEPPARYITIWSRDAPAADDRPIPASARGIVFEVDARGRVNLIHAGGPSIAYVEGCA